MDEFDDVELEEVELEEFDEDDDDELPTETETELELEAELDPVETVATDGTETLTAGIEIGSRIGIVIPRRLEALAVRTKIEKTMIAIGAKRT